MNKPIELTVHELATQARISVRTLHYYDEIDLLKPGKVKSNGYRVYGREEMLKLQQILFFRELDFPLDEIKSIVNSPKFNPREALRDHQRMLTIKKMRIDDLLKTIDETLKTMKGGEQTMSNDDNNLFGSFDPKQMEEYQEEARQKWGHTDMYKQSQQRVAKMSKDDWKRIGDESDNICKAIVANMDKGPQSPEVQEQIDRHYNSLRNFYEPNYEMYRGLGEMYVADKRFTVFYDKYHKDLAKFMCDAMAYYCDTHENK